MNKVEKFFNKYRLIDGYFHFLDATLSYRILAGYEVSLYIFELSLRIHRLIVFSVCFDKNISEALKYKYKSFGFILELFNKTIIDTRKKENEQISRNIDVSMRKSQAEENLKEKVYQDYQEARISKRNNCDYFKTIMSGDESHYWCTLSDHPCGLGYDGECYDGNKEDQV